MPMPMIVPMTASSGTMVMVPVGVGMGAIVFVRADSSHAGCHPYGRAGPRRATGTMSQWYPTWDFQSLEGQGYIILGFDRP